MQNLRVSLLFTNIRDAGEQQRAALDVVQRKAVQALELHTVDEYFKFTVLRDDVYILHSKPSSFVFAGA